MKKNFDKLEAGCAYRRNDGAIITIETSPFKHKDYPFLGSDNNTYTFEGYRWRNKQGFHLEEKLNAPEKEQVNHPEHYNSYPVECIDMMQRIWGAEKTATFCEMNAYKYRMRAGNKGDFAEDLEKERWYLAKAAELSADAEPQQTIECEKAKVQRGEVRARGRNTVCEDAPGDFWCAVGHDTCKKCPHHLATSIDGKRIYCDAPAE